MAKVIRRENETVDELVRRFSKQFMNEGILRELRNREYYKSKGQKRREKRLKSEREAWVRKMKAERYNKY